MPTEQEIGPSDDPLFLMLWRWCEERGMIDQYTFDEGLTPEDFKIMLDEHEVELLAHP